MSLGLRLAIIFLPVAILPWCTLAVTGLSFGPWYATALIVAILWLNAYVWIFLWGSKYRAVSAAVIALIVIELAVGAQGVFAGDIPRDV